MAKRLPKPADSVGYRLDWDKANVLALDVAAARSGLSVASFCRLSLELLVTDGVVTIEQVTREANRLIAAGKSKSAPPPRKGDKKTKTKSDPKS